MAEYHVGCGAFAIYAGTLNKSKVMWLNKTDCTDEALAAVRDYLIDRIEDGKTSFGYEWTRKDGKVVELVARVKDPADKESGE